MLRFSAERNGLVVSGHRTNGTEQGSADEADPRKALFVRTNPDASDKTGKLNNLHSMKLTVEHRPWEDNVPLHGWFAPLP